MNNFGDLGLNKRLAHILKENGITEPTAVQAQAIPILLEGNDVITQAQTGTGKTFTFLLPILEKINIRDNSVQALIITPTRELSLQITSEAKKLSAYKRLNILSVYGGQNIDQQIRKLRFSTHIVIGTPGRIIDHLNRKTINFSNLKVLVLDEADQMFDMGFLPDLKKIVEHLPDERQTLLFSATMPDEIRKLASEYMKQPLHIKVKGKNITIDKIKQLVIEASDRNRFDALCSAIEEYRPFLAIIFCRTKRRAKTLNEALYRKGYKTDELHGDLTQAKREKVMRAFRKTEIQFLIATDVAARGLDVGGVTHVFNYDIPQDPESYIHRIGRTGRAGQEGVAITFVSPKDRKDLHDIEKTIQLKLERTRYEKQFDREIKDTGQLSNLAQKERAIRSFNPDYKNKGYFKKGNFNKDRNSGFKYRNEVKKAGPGGELDKQIGQTKNADFKKPFREKTFKKAFNNNVKA